MRDEAILAQECDAFMQKAGELLAQLESALLSLTDVMDALAGEVDRPAPDDDGDDRETPHA